MKGKKPILLVEDDEVDAMTVRRALRDIHVTNRLDIVTDAEKALTFLRNSKKENPGIIILDLNMPKMNGIEFLKIIKKEKVLKRIPVIILTTSKEEQDKLDSYNLGAAGYMNKPVDYNRFIEVIQAINIYWSLSELPNLA